MATRQGGIFTEGTSFHHYLEYDVSDGFDAAAIGKVLAGKGSANAVVAFGNGPWRKLSSAALEALGDFTAIDGTQSLNSPATQHDLLLWFHAASHDDVLDAALNAQRVLDDIADLKLDVPGFVYRDSRDLAGFVDGSANPKEDARFDAALALDGETGAGGAFVVTQKWVHDLLKFEALPVGDQERVIGRTKPDSIELEGEAMPPASHVSRTDVKLDGTTLKIYCRSAPFGGAGEKRLYFIAISCDLMRFDVMLQRMFGTSNDDLHDQLIHYSTPVTGSYWFAPSEEDLAAAGCTG
jgi:putative iron-dependent peroxidase